jgi:hypothetical protein
VDPMMLHGAERLIAVVIGGMSIVLGFWLFLRISSETNATGKILLPGGISIMLSRVGPGVFFALFGAVLVGLSFYFGIKLETSEGGHSVYSGFTSDRPVSVDTDKRADRAKVLSEIVLLNEISDALQTDLPESNRANIALAVDDAKLALMTRVWWAEWGDLRRFEQWFANRTPQPPDTPLGKAIAVFERGKEVSQ